MTDLLATPEQRDAGVDDLVRGVTLANRLLGLSLPQPAFRRWSRRALADARYADPDLYYMQLTGAIADAVVDESDWPALLAAFDGFLPPQPPLADAFAATREALALDDAALVRHMAALFSVCELDVDEALAPGAFVFAKINHVHWEYVSRNALRGDGQDYHRPLGDDDIDLFQRARFDDLLLHVLRRLQRALQAAGSPPGCFHGHGFSLGISFNNGDGRLADDLVVPVPPIMRGAMAGSQGYFRTFFPAARWSFSDGAFPKLLVWQERLDRFFDGLTQDCDAVVFVVPAALRAIQVRRWRGPSEVIVLPSVRVHQAWPAVLAVAVARLADLAARFPRLVVLVQGALVSVPLAVAAWELQRSTPAAQIRFFDLGQALDVAGDPADAPGMWIRQAELQPVLARTGPFPVCLGAAATDARGS